MRAVAAAAALVAAAVPSTPAAQIFLGVRAGYAVPRGDASSGSSLADQLAGQIPITLDLGLSLTDAITVGAYAAYGIGLLPAARQRSCDDAGLSCAAADLRLGAQANVRVAGPRRLSPWLGLTVGYEELRTLTRGGGLPSDTWSLQGYDAGAQAGLDLLLSPTLRIGPFVSGTIGRFRWVSDGAETDLRDPRLHGWLQVGLRGMFAG